MNDLKMTWRRVHVVSLRQLFELLMGWRVIYNAGRQVKFETQCWTRADWRPKIGLLCDGCVVLFTGWFHRCIRWSDMHHSNASLMHRWINRWIKQRKECVAPKARVSWQAWMIRIIV